MKSREQVESAIQTQVSIARVALHEALKELEQFAPNEGSISLQVLDGGEMLLSSTHASLQTTVAQLLERVSPQSRLNYLVERIEHDQKEIATLRKNLNPQ